MDGHGKGQIQSVRQFLSKQPLRTGYAVFQKNIYSIYAPNDFMKYVKEYILAIGKKNNCREAQPLFDKYLGLDCPCSKISSNSSMVFYLDNIGYSFDFKSFNKLPQLLSSISRLE